VTCCKEPALSILLALIQQYQNNIGIGIVK